MFKQAAGLKPYNFDGTTTIRGVVSTFVRFHMPKKRVRVSKTGKRKAYAVNVHRLAQEMPELEEEFEHEKLVQSIGREVGLEARDVDELVNELSLDATGVVSLEPGAGNPAADLALGEMLEECGASSMSSDIPDTTLAIVEPEMERFQ